MTDSNVPPLPEQEDHICPRSIPLRPGPPLQRVPCPPRHQLVLQLGRFIELHCRGWAGAVIGTQYHTNTINAWGGVSSLTCATSSTYSDFSTSSDLLFIPVKFRIRVAYIF